MVQVVRVLDASDAELLELAKACKVDVKAIDRQLAAKAKEAAAAKKAKGAKKKGGKAT